MRCSCVDDDGHAKSGDAHHEYDDVDRSDGSTTHDRWYSTDKHVTMLSPRNMLSPRPSLANWSPFEKLKSKIKILENTKQEFKSKIEEQEKEKNELISHLRQSKLENQKLQEKVKDLGDSYEMFKTSMVSQEDPFVLRLALEQSRKDFTKVVEEV